MILVLGGILSISFVVLIGLFVWRRRWAILITSLAAVFLFQSGFGLAAVTFSMSSFFLAVATWLFTRADDQAVIREDWSTLAMIGVLGLVQAAIVPGYTALTLLGIMLVVLLLAFGGLFLIDRWLHNRTIKLVGLIGIIVILFVILKSALFEIVTTPLGESFRTASWFGFSYISFRLLHTLRDCQLGRLPTFTLRQYLSYVFFFPALTAGPIDRVQRFVPDYEHSYRPHGHSRMAESGYRLIMGMTKKYVIADTLSLIALNSANAGDAGTLWTWVQLYSYAFQLFFDFSGYTDMAIGLGLLLGIKLPENFDRPYTRRNLALFWQTWHMTLSNWVRAYVFSPLSRYLIKIHFMTSLTMQILISQAVTMLIIGLWHGITANFAIWGLWHGIGLFLHKIWSDATRQRYFNLRQHPRWLRLWHIVGVVITFHFVCLGWVWFALPDMGFAIDVFGRLFGLR